MFVITCLASLLQWAAARGGVAERAGEHDRRVDDAGECVAALRQPEEHPRVRVDPAAAAEAMGRAAGAMVKA